LEWWMPREDLDYVTHEFRQEAFRQHMKDVQMGSPTSIQGAIDQNTVMTMEELLKIVNTH